nr:uncharacterized protein LOC111425988 [Onthophagus taurus]
MRVTPDHWNTFLDFAEQNSELITNRYHGIHGNIQRNLLWTKAANALNSLGHGQKTVAQWRKAVTDWKAKTKAKLSKPYHEIALTRTEKRLLTLMGKQALRKRRKLVIIPGDGRLATEVNSEEEEHVDFNYSNLVCKTENPTEQDPVIESVENTSSVEAPIAASTSTTTTNCDEDQSDNSSSDKDLSEKRFKCKDKRHKCYRFDPVERQRGKQEILQVMNGIGKNVENISNSIDKLVTIYEKLTEFCQIMVTRSEPKTQ